VNSRVIGGCGIFSASRVAARVTRAAQPVRLSPPRAVLPWGTIFLDGPGGERHGVEVRGEEQRVALLRALQLDDEVAGLGQQGDALVGVVVADGVGRDAGCAEGGGHF
jgi:hypothetical protein